MDTTNVMLMVSIGGFIVFVIVIRLALGPQFFFPPPSRNPMNSVNWQLYSEPEKPWVLRARAALEELRLPPRLSGEPPGWSWQAVDRGPVMSVQIDEGSSNGRHICGSITGTPGTLEGACNLRTGLTLTEGRVTLSADGGQSMTLRAGDSLVLYPGFSGKWQNETLARLRFEVTLV